MNRMNEELYTYLVLPWFSPSNRPVCRRADVWTLAYRRVMHSHAYCCLLTDIHLHGGTPCFRRYCICKYFTVQDKVSFYRDLVTHSRSS